VDLCGDCFSVGVSINQHRGYHDYYVVDCLERPIFAKDWTVHEELELLEGFIKLNDYLFITLDSILIGIESYGVGNWKLISEYISTKSVRECCDHYWDLYLGVFGQCIPSKTIVDDAFVATSSLISDFSSISISVPPGHVAGEIITRERVREKDSQSRQSSINKQPLPGSDLQGFMPLRQDFDVEYENDAELPLADMEMGDMTGIAMKDHPQERALKMAVIKIYNDKLDERERRKKLVIDLGLVDLKKQHMVGISFYIHIHTCSTYSYPYCALSFYYFYLFIIVVGSKTASRLKRSCSKNPTVTKVYDARRIRRVVERYY